MALIDNNQIEVKLKLTLFGSLIGSILLYGLNAIHINNARIKKLQTFYSGCIRYLIYGRYEDREERLIGQQISNGLNIPTIESELNYRKYKVYITWKSTMSFSYLNFVDEIEKRLDTINQIANYLQFGIKTLYTKRQQYTMKKHVSQFNIFVNLGR